MIKIENPEINDKLCKEVALDLYDLIRMDDDYEGNTIPALHSLVTMYAGDENGELNLSLEDNEEEILKLYVLSQLAQSDDWKAILEWVEEKCGEKFDSKEDESSKEKDDEGDEEEE